MGIENNIGSYLPKNTEKKFSEGLETKQKTNNEDLNILIDSINNLPHNIGLNEKDTKLITKILLKDDNIVQGKKKDNFFKSINRLQKLTVKSQDPDSCQTFVDVAIKTFPRLEQESQEKINNLIFNTASVINKNNHILATDICARYLTETSKEDKSNRLQLNDDFFNKKDNHKFKFLDKFFPLMTSDEFNNCGQFLLSTSNQEKIKQTPESLFDNYVNISESLLPNMPISVVIGMTESFIEAGLINKSSSGEIKLDSKANKNTLTYDYLLQVTRAQKRIEKNNQIYSKNDHTSIKDIRDVVDVYQTYNKTKSMVELPINLESESLRTLHIAGIGLGHQDVDVNFISDLIEKIKDLPENKKPQVIVLNNLIAGAYENRQKNLKPALVDGLRTMEEQFNAGRIILDELQTLKIPICLNLGAPDWEIARDMVLRILRYQNKLVGHISYYQQDELQRLQEWSVYDKFVIDVALPYCLRKGEVLSAQDLLVLFDLHNKLTEAENNGCCPDISNYEKEIIDIDNIPRPGKVDFGDGLYILDNFALSLGNNDFSQRSVYINDFNFSGSNQPPLYQEPLKSISTRVTQSLASGKIEPGDSYTILNQHEFIARDINGKGTWIESMPSIQSDDFLTNSGSRNRTMDASRRQATTRRRLSSIEAPIVEVLPGRRIYHLLNKDLMELADSTERTTIIMNGDEQTGSVTARPDLMIKAWDIAIEKFKENKVILGFFGDGAQGNNYKQKIQQEVAVGMQASVEHQLFLNNTLLELSYKHVSDLEMKSLKDVIIIPGNHELNSGFTQYGTTYMDSFVQTWNNITKEKNSPLRTKISENVVTGDGSFYKGWIADIRVGDYRGIAQHYPLKKGGKGMNDMPIYQSWPLLQSMIEDAKDINFMHFQHYHHSTITEVAGKIVTIGPAKAGQSEFEHYLGCKSTPGMMMLHLGGGLPPAVEFLSFQALLDHKINDKNYFSDKNLKEFGFVTDENFNPKRDGSIPWVTPFSVETLLKGMPQRHPQSALQKYLCELTASIPLQVNTTIG